MKISKEIRVAIALLVFGATAVLAGKGFNSGKAFPYIGNDEESAVFIAMSIAYSAAEQGGEDAKKASKAVEDAAKDGEEIAYLQYGRDLAKTLSFLSQAEQDILWYGGDYDGGSFGGDNGGDIGGGDTGGGDTGGGRTEVMDLFGQGLSTGDLKSALLGYSPLQTPELNATVGPDAGLSTGDLKTVLLDNSPLPTEILSLVIDYSAPLSSGDRQAVLDAHAGGDDGDD